MDFIRQACYIRFALAAALVGAAAYVAPAVWATDRTLFGFVSFDQVTFVLSLVLAYAALRVSDGALRAKLALGVIAAFGLATTLLLGFSAESLVLLVLAVAFGYLELPRQQATFGIADCRSHHGAEEEQVRPPQVPEAAPQVVEVAEVTEVAEAPAAQAPA